MPAHYVLVMCLRWLERFRFPAYDPSDVELYQPPDYRVARRRGVVPGRRAAVARGAWRGRVGPLFHDDARYADTGAVCGRSKASTAEEYTVRQYRLRLLPGRGLRHADGVDSGRRRLDPLSVWRNLFP